jgi:two-component sensor histidine kinase
MTSATSPKSNQLYWVFQATGWSLYTIIRIVAAVSALQIPLSIAVFEISVLDLIALGLSHGLRTFVRRHHWTERGIPGLALRMIVAGFMLGVPLGIATQLSHVAELQDSNSLLREHFPLLDSSVGLLIRYLLQITNWAVLFIIWQAFYFISVGLREYRSTRLRQSELTQALQLAELRLLKSQLNPHFLFNALNTVRSLIADNPVRAQNAVTRLANTLRHSLRSRQEELVTLAQEMTIVNDYLELESMRFEDRLRIETAVPADAEGVLVPVMILQTLVENAIKHGIAELPAGGLLAISATLDPDVLTVEIQNPRPPEAKVASNSGVGLRNASDRLRLLFGSRASLELDLSLQAVATVRLRVPRRQ